MFGKFQDLMKQWQAVQRIMKDESFRSLMRHPKIQALLSDPAVLEAFKSKDFVKIAQHPKVLSLMQDPELAPLLAQMPSKVKDNST